MFVGSVITQYALGAQTMPFGTAFTVMCFCALILFMLMGYGLKRLLARGVLRWKLKSVGATGFNVTIFLIFLFLYVPMAIILFILHSMMDYFLHPGRVLP